MSIENDPELKIFLDAIHRDVMDNYNKLENLNNKELAELTKDDLEKEIIVLDHLVDAFNEFIKLESQHPDEQRDFTDGIHKCQYLIGMRIARNYRPDIYPIKRKK